VFTSDRVLGSSEIQNIASIGASARVTRSTDMQNTKQRGSGSAEVRDADTQHTDGTPLHPRVDDTDPGTRMRTSVRRQREQFGGLNWGSAFFGWLVARRDRHAADRAAQRRGRRGGSSPRQPPTPPTTPARSGSSAACCCS
jgi:hypothetical protein